MINLSSDQYVLIIIRLGYLDESFTSLYHIQKVNKDDHDQVQRVFERLADMKTENYFNAPVEKLILTYKLIAPENLKSKTSKFSEVKPVIESPTTRIRGYSIPNTTHLEDFGKITSQVGNRTVIQRFNSNYFYEVFKYNDHNHVLVLDGDVTFLEFKDHFDEKTKSKIKFN